MADTPKPTPDPKLESLGDPLAAGVHDAAAAAALDAAFSDFEKKRTADPDAGEGDDAPVVAPKTDDAVAVKPAVGDDAAATKPAGDTKPDDGAAKLDDATKPASDAKPDDGVAKPIDDKPAVIPPVDPYPAIQLPPTARGASAQAFATLKTQAAKDIGERDTKLNALQAELTKLQEQAKSTVPLKEVEDLRKQLDEATQFRARLDIEADPAFNAKFTTRADTAREFIYSRLATGNISAETITKVKELGGPDKVEMGPILEKIADPQLKRVIQAKLDDLDTVAFEREQALKAAQSNVSEYVAGRQKELTQASSAHTEATKETLTGILAEIPWMAPKQVESKATPEQKTAAEKHTAFLADVNKTLADAMSDDSPQMRAVLVSGLAHVMHLKARYAEITAAHKSLETKLADTEKKLAEVTEKWESAKRSGSARRETNAPSTGLPKTVDVFTTTADEAIEKFMATRGAQ